MDLLEGMYLVAAIVTGAIVGWFRNRSGPVKELRAELAELRAKHEDEVRGWRRENRELADRLLVQEALTKVTQEREVTLLAQLVAILNQERSEHHASTQ